MSRILLLSESAAQAKNIKNTIEANMPQKVNWVKNEDDAKKYLSSRKDTSLVIYETVHFEQGQFGTLQGLRTAGYSSSFLVLSDILLFSSFFEMRDKFAMHFLEKPYEEKDLIGIARKLHLARTLPQQVHKRFRTNQSAEIEPLMSGEAQDSSLFNLSKGGAYCEYSGESKFAIGDIVRLNIQLSEVNSQHSMSAKVVWKTKKGKYTGRNGAGLKFLKSDDIYRFLLDRM